MNCLVLIKEAQNSYTSTEKIIAQYILEHTREVMGYSAQVLGEKSGTSAAAVIRFSKKLGYKGFSELKMSLASSKQTQESDIDVIINSNDDITTIVDKCCRLNMNTVLKTYQMIHMDSLIKDIEQIHNSHTIYLFAVGGSAVVAQDFSQKLIRIGKKVIFNADLHVQMTFAESMTTEDVGVFISYSGKTKGIVDMIKYLSDRNIPTISITQYSKNLIAKRSGICLYVPVEEQAIRIGAISSRIASLVMTDLLYYGLLKYDLNGNRDKLVETRGLVSKI